MTGSTPPSSDDPAPFDAEGTSLLDVVARAWARTDRGWRAVLVAAVVATAVQLGVPIPW